ncbi:MAG: Crp/Fnr family transcriptional regulator [Gammaproteobacteria bacterium]|nr:MAG: Crp/Fnr family transcriptional regulator [Gammaproteobacteria bacterium]
MLHALTTASLRRHYLFSKLSEDELNRIGGHAQILDLQAGEQLFMQDTEAHHFYQVHAGQIKLSRLNPDGNEKVIEILNPGETFAEAVMFMQINRYPVTATAVQPSTVYAFKSQVFLDIVRNNNDLCLRLLGDMAMRLRSRMHEIEQLTMKNATYRVVRYFMQELEKAGDEVDELELNIQKQLLASRLSIKPETLSRILGTLRDQGLIRSQGKKITLLDPEALRAYE